jgi:DNA-binding XRE family transcriptional regulator
MKHKPLRFESETLKRLTRDPEFAQSFFEDLRAKPVALQLKFIRRLRGVAQHDLAQALHLKQAFISKLESNKKGHRLKTYEQIAAYLKGNLVFLPKYAKIVVSKQAA